jgi:mono/diheme cytochrome c family protein
MRKQRIFVVAVALGVGVSACQQSDDPAVDATRSDARANLTLPVSTNAAMVGMVDQAADYIFAVGNGDLPRNANDWHLVSNSAYVTMLSGTVIQVPGTGQFDRQWTENPEWIELSEELTRIGADAVALAESESTDVPAWRAIGDRLIQNCLDCHQKFKPEIPSEGILRGSTERQSRGISIFGY